jgi:predicted RNase H-like nuclease (RuvC/YqgF family)
MNKKSVEKIKAQKDEKEYEKQIRGLEKEVRRLKSENKTLQTLLDQNDSYIYEMVKDRPVAELMTKVKESTPEALKDKCPNCQCDEMKKINLGTMQIVVCTRCSYRNRLNAGNQPA